MKLHLDFETRSEVNLNDVGAYKYAMHPSTEILCMGWAIDAGPVQVSYPPWAPVFPTDAIIVAHNAQFEYAIYHHILHKRYGWPERLDPRGWSCTMSRAAMCGLPLGLGDLGAVLGAKIRKDLGGRRVMHQLCKPVGYDFLGDPIWDTDPAKLAALYAYNKIDVQTEMEIDGLLPELPASERAIWEHDLVVNYRGVRVDLEMAQKAQDIAGILTDDLNAKLRAMTGGFIDKATQVTTMKEYLKSNGVEVPTQRKKNSKGEMVDSETLGAQVIPEILSRPNLPPVVRSVLSIRCQVGKSSTAKYANTILTACPDGRVRGVLQYHAAHTGRWSGRLIQPQNYPKGFKTAEKQAAAIRLILAGDAAAFVRAYGDKSMQALSDALRGSIVSGAGSQFVSADYNAIEARVLFWLANDVEALAMYARGESPYLDMAQKIYNRPCSKKGTPQEYDIGKRTILGCGYGMGAKKFKDNVYSETAKVGTPVSIPADLAERAVKTYRKEHDVVVNLWNEFDAAAVQAVKRPGVILQAAGGRVLWGMSVDRRFLKCRLPSGRFLWYWRPVVKKVETPWGEMKEAMCYQGEDPQRHQWGLLKTYGGSLTENVVQATARDLLAHGMLAVEEAGFPVVLTVHDEILSEIPDGPGDQLTDFIARMCAVPAWAKGCPVAAEGWVGSRYRK